VVSLDHFLLFLDKGIPPHISPIKEEEEMISFSNLPRVREPYLSYFYDQQKPSSARIVPPSPPPDKELHTTKCERDPKLVAEREDLFYPSLPTYLGWNLDSKMGNAMVERGFYRRPGGERDVWRKREVLVQERIVQYTTVDKEGKWQDLVEVEKSQTEVRFG